jgi:hypothetical protein
VEVSEEKIKRDGRDKIMKTIRGEKRISQHWKRLQSHALAVAGFLLALLPTAHAVLPDPGGTNSSPVYAPLNTWSFYD